ncbi:MAG TPA: LuxR C-terminal-related transcriptional regulator [Candidatus Dormibacteraeota bacterium]|nr:LuxR C-terminal-related transcriptional regulator [Candidatus Dormibacteraeota bacterium]
MGGKRSADGLFMTDGRQRVVVWSRSAEETLGHPAASVIGRPCYEVIAGIEPSGHPVCRRGCRPVANARRGRVTPDYEVMARDHHGDRVCLNSSIVLVNRREPGSPYLLHLVRRRGGSPPVPVIPPDGVGAQPAPPVGQSLSRREFHVLRLLATGRTVVEIAALLSISRYTVRNHVHSIERKIGARNRLEAVVLAARHGLI